MNLISLHILPTNVAGDVSSIYSTMQSNKLRMQSTKGKCLRTKPKHKVQFPSNPQNFSPIGIHCQNGRKDFEGKNSESSSTRCAYPKTRVITHAHIQRHKLGGIQTKLRIKDCKQNNTSIDFQQKKRAIKRSKRQIK
jgi:hypothetical protein